MIRYYAYYSCGGYKDLYLGDNSCKCDYTYFLPLLATWQKGSKPEYSEKLKLIEGLQQIKVVSKNDYLNFPPEAKNLFSHGGYRVIYLTLSNGDTCLCVRDITNGVRDEEDRDIPFTLLITASGKEDIKLLDQFSLESLKQISGLYELMSPLFSYDPVVNGIKFKLSQLYNAICDVSSSNLELQHHPNEVNYLVVDSMSMVPTALNELNLKRDQIDYIKSIDGRFLGSMEYKKTYEPVKQEINDIQTTDADEEDLTNDLNQDKSLKEPKMNVVTTSEEPDDTISHMPRTNESQSTDFIENNLEIGSEVLDKQYSNIQESLRDILRHLINLTDDINDSKSTASSEILKILDKIESQKDNVSTSPQIITDMVKDNNSICISKVHLWLLGIALIVGILLGALIF